MVVDSGVTLTCVARSGSLSMLTSLAWGCAPAASQARPTPYPVPVSPITAGPAPRASSRNSSPCSGRQEWRNRAAWASSTAAWTCGGRSVLAPNAALPEIPTGSLCRSRWCRDAVAVSAGRSTNCRSRTRRRRGPERRPDSPAELVAAGQRRCDLPRCRQVWRSAARWIHCLRRGWLTRPHRIDCRGSARCVPTEHEGRRNRGRPRLWPWSAKAAFLLASAILIAAFASQRRRWDLLD